MPRRGGRVGMESEEFECLFMELRRGLVPYTLWV
jgi:hypothetical protein